MTLLIYENKIYSAPIGDLLASERDEKSGTIRHAGLVVLQQEMAVLHGSLLSDFSEIQGQDDAASGVDKKEEHKEIINLNQRKTELTHTTTLGGERQYWRGRRSMGSRTGSKAVPFQHRNWVRGREGGEEEGREGGEGTEKERERDAGGKIFRDAGSVIRISTGRGLAH